MNILFISHNANQTGAPLALLCLLKSIKEKAKDLTFSVFLMDNGPLTEQFKELCHVISPQSSPWNLKKVLTPVRLRDRLFIRMLIHHIKSQHYDLIYANTISSFNCAISLKEILHIPILLHIHESKSTLSAFNINSRTLGKCDHMIAVSHKEYDSLREMGVEKDRISVIYPISSLAEKLLRNPLYSQIEKTEKDWSRITIGCVGPLISRKGADFIPMVMNALFTRHPDCNFEIHIIGDYLDELRDTINYDIKRIGGEKNIHFHGMIKDPILDYNNIDVLLVLSREESFSLVVLEFGLMGKPVILFDGSCGVQHFLRNNDNSIIVPYMDFNAIADAIDLMAKRHEECLRLGRNLQSTMREHYNTTSTNEAIIEVIYLFNKKQI